MSRLTHIRDSEARRAQRVGAKIHGTAARPRLAVHISNLHVTAQLVDDDAGNTLVYVSSVGKKATGTMIEKAAFVGKDLAVAAKKAKISKVVFDRGSRKYHGRVKALAEAAREGGLEF